MALQLIRCTTRFQSSFILKSNFKNYNSRQILLSGNKSYSTNSKPGWNSWRSIVVRFVPIGICLIAVMQWRVYRKIMSTRVAKQWEIDLYCSLPLRAFSRYWGWMADKNLPVFLRPWVYGLYANMFGVDIAEAESSNLKDYPSLADFFARGLKSGARIVDVSSSMISPCDGKVLHFGPVNSCYVEQVKGVTYSLPQFLGDLSWRDSKPNNSTDYRNSLLIKPENKPTTLYQCILYLAPGDYHRFHSPAEWKPVYRRHFSGELLSVSPMCAKWIPGLFCLNERAVYLGQWKHGFFSYTAVGATNVGSVKVYFDRTLHTNIPHQSKSNCDSISLKPLNISLEKGDAIGEFRMGSTIVLIFEAPINFQFNLVTGQKVRMGQSIGSFRQLKYVDQISEPNFNSMNNVS